MFEKIIYIELIEILSQKERKTRIFFVEAGDSNVLIVCNRPVMMKEKDKSYNKILYKHCMNWCIKILLKNTLIPSLHHV